MADTVNDQVQARIRGDRSSYGADCAARVVALAHLMRGPLVWRR
jgi:hypothetical protein